MKTLIYLMALCTPFLLAQTEEGYEIRLKSGIFTPNPEDSIMLEGRSDTRQYVIIQFNELPALKSLTDADIRPVHYIPQNAVMASVPSDFSLSEAPNARWMGRILDEEKLSDTAQAALSESGSRASTLLVWAFPDVNTEDVENAILKAGGNVNIHPNFPGYIRLATGDRAMFEKLSANPLISWINTANEAVLKGEPVHFCAGPATIYGTVPDYVTNGNGWDGAGLGSASLTYRFVNGTPDITSEQTQVKNAINTWANYADLTFTQTYTSNLNKSFDISWGSGNHGDGYPFDGAGGTLAHAYYPAPPNSEPIAGDIHFDEAETWSVSGNTHMFSVALHEAGHSLGLNHSNTSGAVMQAFYSGPVTGLHSDDIAGIRALYSNTSGLAAPSLTVFSEYCYGLNSASWNAVSGATSYKLYTSSVNNPSGAYLYWTGTTTTKFMNVSSNQYVWVKACDSSDCSGFSNSGQARYYSVCY